MESVFRMVVFQIGAEYFGMEIRGVRGIVAGLKAEDALGAHTLAKRVLHLGKEVVPILNVYEKLQIEPLCAGESVYYLIFDYQAQSVAIPIDMPEKYYDVPIRNLSPVPVLLQSFRKRYFQQIVRLGERLVFVLSPGLLFS